MLGGYLHLKNLKSLSSTNPTRTVNMFEENMASRRGSEAIYLHHKQTKNFLDKFCQHVISLVSMMEELENLFLENDETF